jgi:hypothetical protein
VPRSRTHFNDRLIDFHGLDIVFDLDCSSKLKYSAFMHALMLRNGENAVFTHAPRLHGIYALRKHGFFLRKRDRSAQVNHAAFIANT